MDGGWDMWGLESSVVDVNCSVAWESAGAFVSQPLPLLKLCLEIMSEWGRESDCRHGTTQKEGAVNGKQRTFLRNGG